MDRNRPAHRRRRRNHVDPGRRRKRPTRTRGDPGPASRRTRATRLRGNVNPEDYERAMDALFHDTDLMMFAAGRPVADILEAGPTGPLSRENAGWLIPLGRHLGVDVDVM